VRNYAAQIQMQYSDIATEYVTVDSHWINTCDGVKHVECQLPTNDCTLLNVVFEPNTKIERHKHDNSKETIFVVEGEIIDLETNTIIGTNAVYIIPAGRYHTLYSKQGALLNILFHPKLQPFLLNESS
jgi:quercetin dioxygenase-like cupin family protein